jgi:hypothetical protein
MSRNDRKFSRRTALAAMAAPLAAQGPPQQPLPAADQAEVDAKLASVIRKYGDRLSEEQRTRVRGVIARHHRMLMRVRAFPLENSDSTATGLRLYPNDTRPEGRK